MSILDYIIIFLLILGGLNGFRKGILNSAVSLLGFIAVIIVSFYLKNFLSEILYENLPFINFTGIFEGLQVYNVLIYEGISYLLTMTVLSIVLGILLRLTGIVDSIANSTILIGIPSKILGAVFGLVEGYVLVFICLFLLNVMIPSSSFVQDSKYTNDILTRTPILSQTVENSYNSIIEIFSISKKYANDSDKTLANKEALRVLLKYEIITKESAQKLVEDGKLDFDGAEDVINNYRKED